MFPSCSRVTTTWQSDWGLGATALAGRRGTSEACATLSWSLCLGERAAARWTLAQVTGLKTRHFRSAKLLLICRNERGDDFGFTQETGSFFGRRGIDVEAGAPFEARDFGELRNNLEVPVIVVVNFLADG